jgi:SAM-dependent methyltransferase
MTDRARARALAREAAQRGDAVQWFELLYAEAKAGTATVPWADGVPNPHVARWLDRRAEHHGRALDVGTGLGDNAAELRRRGYDVVAFDVSPTAVAQARVRFDDPRIELLALDALALPDRFTHAFDLVVECYTLQVLPPAARAIAAKNIARCVAAGGTLLVVARGREPSEPEGTMPWPLTRAEIEALAMDGLTLTSFEDFLDDEDPPVRRFRATFTRASPL